MTLALTHRLETLLALRQDPASSYFTEEQVFERLVQPLFNELGWDIGTEVETVRDIGPLVSLSGNSHALMLLKPISLQVPGIPRDHLSQLLGYAYNRNADWTVVTNFDRLTVYQTRWFDAYTKATPSLDLMRDTYVSQPDRLLVLAPDSVATGHLSKVLGARDRETLLPVHELLFRHFQRWRQALLTYGAGRPGVDLATLDQEIQHFFNQLILLRSLEDTDRLGDQTLRNIYQTWTSGTPRIDLKREIRNLIQALARRTGSELFRWPETLDFVLSDQLLQGIIERLYRAGLMVPIDFGVINADIIGGMYEHFLSSAARQSTEEELRALAQSPRLIPEHPITVGDVRKEKGIYFTPPSLAEYITTVACEAWYEGGRERGIPAVLDFACGSGTILVEAFQYLIDRMPGDSPLSHIGAKRAIISNLFGVDLSSVAAGDTVANLLHAALLPVEDVGLIEKNVRVGNSLIAKEERILRDYFGAAWEQLGSTAWSEFGPSSGDSGKFDIILANPPFKSTEQMQHGPERAYFGDQYQVARGRWDQAFLFLELALRLVKEDGVIALVMPASVLKSQAGALTRLLIEERNALFQIVDFTDKMVFAGVSTYITLLFLKPNWHGRVKNIEIQEFPETETGRSWFFHHLRGGQTPPGMSVSISEADKPQNNGAPWIIASPREHELKYLMEQKGRLYPTNLTVDQGVKTGLNQAFLVEEIAGEKGSGLIAVKTPLGIRTVESAFLRPAVLGEDISRYSLSPGGRRLIYSYRSDGSVVPEELLEEEAYNLWLYLNEWKTRLAARKSLKRVTGPWYSFIWARGAWLNQPKVLGPDYARQSSFAYDNSGEVVPVGGNAIVSADLDFRVVLGIVNSSLASWYVTQSSVRRRGNYFAFYGRYIENLPIVNVSLLPNADQLQELIVERVDRLLTLQNQIKQDAASDLRISQLASEIGKLDKELDELVLHLYGAYDFKDLVWG